MTEYHSFHSDKSVRERLYAIRGLDWIMPSLKKFLFPRARVLDVGCGPGTITIDVARAVSPNGSVIGIDVNTASIEQAKSLKEEMDIANLAFVTADTYNLPFPDAEFDVVYSNAVFEWLDYPSAALAEMIRVANRGAIVAAQDWDWGGSFMYPRCRSWEKWLQAWNYFSQTREPSKYGMFHFGRELFALFRRADLENVEASESCHPHCFQGSEHFQLLCEIVKMHCGGAWTPFWQKLVQEGLLDQSTLDEAQREIDAWTSDPDAFFMGPVGVFVAGKVS